MKEFDDDDKREWEECANFERVNARAKSDR